MRAGAEEFEEIYRAYFDDVFKLVYHRIPNRPVAEDVVQDTFFAALKRGEEFLSHPEPKLWLFRTARFKILELYRRTRRQVTEPLEDEAPELARQEGRYGEVELDLSALAAVGEEEWRMIKAHYLFGTPMSEIAEAEAVTENNMRVRMFRYRRKLQNRIGL